MSIFFHVDYVDRRLDLENLAENLQDLVFEGLQVVVCKQEGSHRGESLLALSTRLFISLTVFCCRKSRTRYPLLIP